MGRLGRLALAQLPRFGARDVTLALDAFARLGAKPCGQGLRPPRGLLAGLAARAARLAGELEAAQLPLVVWALGALRAEVAMGALSDAVARRAPAFSAQVRFCHRLADSVATSSVWTSDISAVEHGDS